MAAEKGTAEPSQGGRRRLAGWIDEAVGRRVMNRRGRRRRRRKRMRRMMRRWEEEKEEEREEEEEDEDREQSVLRIHRRRRSTASRPTFPPHMSMQALMR